MLIACEATVELYMGLAASPQMQVGALLLPCPCQRRRSATGILPNTSSQLNLPCPALPTSVPPTHHHPSALPRSPPIPSVPQWVYFSEDGPVEVLEEVQEQLLGAYEFIQEREAEAPAQYRAVQVRRQGWRLPGLGP